MKVILFLTLVLTCFPSYGTEIIRKKSIPYISPGQKGFDPRRNSLDIFYAADSISSKPVFIFIHGGSWGSGNKNIYRAMGRSLAKKGYVAVIINYRLAPKVQYAAITNDCAKALIWVHQNIMKFGGDPKRITLTGHSAGAHLSASILVKKTYEKWNITNPIRQLILIDPFGLDMVSFFSQHDTRYSRSLYKVFTTSSSQWRIASPIYDINETLDTPVKILVGSKTYRIIREQSKIFYDSLRQHNVPAQYHIIKGKRHIGMITQFFKPRSKAYEILLKE